MALSWVFNPFTSKLDAVDGAGAGASNSFGTIDCPAGTDPVADSATDTLTLTSSNSSITITGDSTTDTIDFTLTTPVNSFATINAPAGTDPVADSATDTLNLTTSDSKLTITGDSTTDTLDFTAPTLIVGPASATDNAVVRYDSTTGKLTQNSAVTLDDSGNLVPTVDNVSNFGSLTNRWAIGLAGKVIAAADGGDAFSATTAGGTLLFQLHRSTNAPSGATSGISLFHSTQSQNLFMYTASNATANATATPSILIETGNKTAGTGDSGSLNFTTGTSSGGARGSIQLNSLQTNIGPSTGLFLNHEHSDPFFFGDTGPAVMSDSTVANNNDAILFGSTDVSTDTKSHEVSIQTGMNSSATTAGVKTGRLYLQTGIITTSGDGESGQIFMETGEVFDGISGLIRIRSGFSTNGTGNTGTVSISSGNADSGDSGNVSIFSGTSASGTKGEISISGSRVVLTADAPGGIGEVNILSANAPVDVTSDPIYVQTGTSSGTGASGPVGLITGDVENATSGNIDMTTGASSGGTRGDITLSANRVLVSSSLALQNAGATVNLTADNTTITVGSRSHIRISSDSVVATDRTFILSQSTTSGHILILEWEGTNTGELIDDSAQGGGGNHRLSATWIPTQYDTLMLISNGTDWIEVCRSIN